VLVPRLWDQSLDAHRGEVRDVILQSVGALAAEAGLRSVTMSKVAARAGIGRATLYRYFPDVEAVLRAWHEAQVTGHVAQLSAIADAADPHDRLSAVLEAFALLSQRSHAHHDAELEAFLHRDRQVDRAREDVHALLATLIGEAARRGEVRDDVAADELASYCLHALGAATSMTSSAAVRRLVAVTRAGLCHP
jgi:AcrR family transcriptional regulator